MTLFSFLKNNSFQIYNIFNIKIEDISHDSICFIILIITLFIDLWKHLENIKLSIPWHTSISEGICTSIILSIYFFMEQGQRNQLNALCIAYAIISWGFYLIIFKMKNVYGINIRLAESITTSISNESFLFVFYSAVDIIVSINFILPFILSKLICFGTMIFLFKFCIFLRIIHFIYLNNKIIGKIDIASLMEED